MISKSFPVPLDARDLGCERGWISSSGVIRWRRHYNSQICGSTKEAKKTLFKRRRAVAQSETESACCTSRQLQVPSPAFLTKCSQVQSSGEGPLLKSCCQSEGKKMNYISLNQHKFTKAPANPCRTSPFYQPVNKLFKGFSFLENFNFFSKKSAEPF